MGTICYNSLELPTLGFDGVVIDGRLNRVGMQFSIIFCGHDTSSLTGGVDGMSGTDVVILQKST